PEPAPVSTGDLSGLIVGAVAGAVFALSFGLLDEAVPLEARGLILGGLTGVLFAPFIAIALFLSMLFRPWTPQGMMAESVMSRLTNAAIHRRYGRLAVGLSFFVLVGMVVGGLLGYHTRSVGPALTVPAVLGGAILGAVVGTLCGAALGTRGMD